MEQVSMLEGALKECNDNKANRGTQIEKLKKDIKELEDWKNNLGNTSKNSSSAVRKCLQSKELSKDSASKSAKTKETIKKIQDAIKSKPISEASLEKELEMIPEDELETAMEEEFEKTEFKWVDGISGEIIK